MAIILLAPSASSWSCRARSAHTSVSTPVNSARSGVTPDAPLAISSTVSLVDMQPSVSSRSKVTAVAERSAASSWSGARSASVVSTHSMVARPGASIPAPLAIPPTRVAVDPPEGDLGHGVGGPDRVGGGQAAAPGGGGHRGVHAGQQLVHRQPLADQAGRADRDLPAPNLRWPAARCSAVAWVSWKPSGPVQALAPPELSTTARTRPPLTTCRAPGHRGGLHPVGGEHGGGGPGRPVVEDHGHVRLAGLLQPGRDAGGPETQGAVTLMGTLRVRSGRPSPAGRA